MSIQAIEDEILDGLSNEVAGLEDARVNYDFYRADFDAYDPRGPEDNPDRTHQRPSKVRTAPVMQRVVEALARHLYARGPSRILPSEHASEWLAATYADSGVDALLQEADCLSTVASYAAVEAYDRGAEGDPDYRVGLRVWGRHQLIVWEDPDNVLEPLAVAVLDCFDQTRRLRLWTVAEVREYRTAKILPLQTAGGTAFTLYETKENPYGCIPFAFIHYKRPTVSFDAGSPGTGLRNCNDYINFRLTETGGNLEFCGNPVTSCFGVGANWTPRLPVRPGDIWFPTAGNLDASGNGIPPSIESLTHDLSFSDVSWDDIRNTLDMNLECNGVPQSVIRLVQTAAASGMAIVAEQLPLIDRAKSRQRPFTTYEQALARVTLAVGRYCEDPTLDPAEAKGLVLRWPAIVPEAPAVGAAQDQADDWALSHGVKSRTQVVMSRFNLSREEALKHLADVVADAQAEAELGLPPLPSKPATPTATPAAETDGEDAIEVNDDEPPNEIES